MAEKRAREETEQRREWFAIAQSDAVVVEQRRSSERNGRLRVTDQRFPRRTLIVHVVTDFFEAIAEEVRKTLVVDRHSPDTADCYFTCFGIHHHINFVARNGDVIKTLSRYSDGVELTE